MASNGEQQQKMNPKVKKLWIKALRSGKYKQGINALRKKEGGEFYHCCLGVLEEVRVAETGARFSTGRRENCNLLSDATREWAGLDEADPVLMPKKGLTAAELNDDGKTFRFIADQIERHL